MKKGIKGINKNRSVKKVFLGKKGWTNCCIGQNAKGYKI
jgi:hypothetical protein